MTLVVVMFDAFQACTQAGISGQDDMNMLYAWYREWLFPFQEVCTMCCSEAIASDV